MDPIAKRAAQLSDMNSYSVYELSVGDSDRLGMQEGKSENVMLAFASRYSGTTAN